MQQRKSDHCNFSLMFGVEINNWNVQFNGDLYSHWVCILVVYHTEQLAFKRIVFFLPRRQWLKLDFIYCIILLVSLLTACNCKFHNPGISGSMSVSKQQHTYPSPNPSLDRTCYQFTLIRLVVFPSFPALSAKGALLEKTKQRLLIRPEASLHLLTHSGWMTTKTNLTAVKWLYAFTWRKEWSLTGVDPTGTEGLKWFVSLLHVNTTQKLTWIDT